jgi:hypothetical protein
MYVRSHRRTIGAIALGLSLALGLAACGSDSDTSAEGGDTGDSATTTIAQSTEPGVGVTDDEIKIGVVMVDYEPIKDYIDFNRGDQQAVTQSIIDDINKKGGIAGRQIVPVYKKYVSIGSAGPLEACTMMTEDEKVFATVGLLYDPSGAGQLCFTKSHKSILITNELSEAIMKKSTPGLLMTPDALAERSTRIMLALADEKGLLEGKKFAVVAETGTSSRIKDVIEPELQKLGLETGTSGTLEISDGDTTKAQAQLDSLIERWKGEGVNAVFISGLSTVSKTYVDKIKKAIPDALLLTDADSSAKAAGQDAVNADVSPNPYDGIISLAGLNDQAEFERKQTADCIKIWEKASGTTVVAPKDIVAGPDGKRAEIWITARDACNTLGFLKVIADRVGKNLNYENWVNTVNTFGKTDQFPNTDAGSLGVGKYDANDNFSLVQFDPTAGTSGDWKQLTPLQDTSDTANG